MIAVLVIALLAAGGIPAHGQEGTEPEDCDDNPVAVADGGTFALFDVYWDATDKNLVNNPCPPRVTHVEVFEEEITTRFPSDVNISETVFHVPHKAMQTLVEMSDPNAMPRIFGTDEYGFLGSEGDQLWILRDENTDLLHIGFSAGLLRAEDWVEASGPDTLGPIQYEFESIREPGLNPDDRGRVVVFEDADADPDTADEITWDTDYTHVTAIPVTPGEYVHRHWAFTKPGTYQFGVQVKGHPQSSLVRTDTVTSEVVVYTFHVGLLADIGVGITVSDDTPSRGDTVTFTITASNKGPDAAPATEVAVELPSGLTHSAASPSVGSYDPATGIWAIGEFAAPEKDEDGNLIPTTHTLTITATVGADVLLGNALDTTARITATETIGSSEVTELDPHTEDQEFTVSVTPPEHPNTDPLFLMERSVMENSAPGTLVGDPLPVRENDDGDTLTFTLTGHGSKKFAVSSVDAGAQIAVAPGASLNYEEDTHYDRLVLQVSDGKDSQGNTDESVDASIALRIDVGDDPEENLRVSLEAEGPHTRMVGDTVLFTGTLVQSPVDSDEVEYRWGEVNNPPGGGFSENQYTPLTRTVTYHQAATREYTLRAWYRDEHGNIVENVDSNTVVITWVWTNP